MGELTDSNLIARLVARLSVQAYASPRYLEFAGDPAHPCGLAQHACLGFPKAGKWTLRRGTETVEVEVGGRFQVNSIGMLRRLAILDLGVILLPEEVAADDLATGRLRPVLPEWYGNPTAVYAITEARLLPAKTLRFVEFLQECLSLQARSSSNPDKRGSR